jgi:hypothetical protein
MAGFNSSDGTSSDGNVLSKFYAERFDIYPEDQIPTTTFQAPPAATETSRPALSSTTDTSTTTSAQTSATTTPASSSSATTTPTASSSGLSSGSKAAIGVAVGIGVPLIILLAVIAFFLRRRRNKRNTPPASVSAPSGAAPPYDDKNSKHYSTGPSELATPSQPSTWGSPQPGASTHLSTATSTEMYSDQSWQGQQSQPFLHEMSADNNAHSPRT